MFKSMPTDTVEQMSEHLRSQIANDPIDEHRKMCDRKNYEEQSAEEELWLRLHRFLAWT